MRCAAALFTGGKWVIVVYLGRARDDAVTTA
jgi:hypothetical protein